MTTEPLGERVLDAIDYRGAVSDGEGADNHYRVTPDGRLMWSGRVTLWPGNPRRYGKRLRRDIRRVYPQLGKVEISHAWSGVLGKTVHKMPQIGEVSSGLWLASEFSGHGLNTTAMAGEIIARAIVENDETWKLFSPYELVWAGGAAGRTATQIAYWVKRITAGADAFFARNREANRLAQAEKARQLAEAEAARAAEAAVQAEAQKESEEAARAFAQADAISSEPAPEPAPIIETVPPSEAEAPVFEAAPVKNKGGGGSTKRKRKARKGDDPVQAADPPAAEKRSEPETL